MVHAPRLLRGTYVPDKRGSRETSHGRSSSGDTWSDPFDMVAPKPQVAGDYSCGYTSLLATGPDSFLIAYSDFKHRAPDGAFRKAIKVREVRVSPAR